MSGWVICPYCGVGCRLEPGPRPKPAAGTPALCGHGLSYTRWYAGNPRRLKKPLVRVAGVLREASWSEALERAAVLLREAAAQAGGWHGVGFIGGSKLFNEEAWALQKLARLLGSPNIDTCSRLCHYPTLLAQLETLGFGGLTAPYSELLESEAVLVVGWNGAVTAPVLFAHYVLGAVRRGAKLVVVDVWRSETARLANLWVRVKPGGDALLAAALARLTVDEGVAPEAKKYVENLEEVLRRIVEIDPEAYAKAAGIDPETLEETHRVLSVERGSILWGMGVTQHTGSKTTIHWLLTLAALRGWLWRKGCVVGGVRGQSNVQGVNDMGLLPEFLPGYWRVDDPQARRLFARVWGVEPPSEPGLPETLMLEEAGRRIHALLVAGENSAVSHPRGEKLLSRLAALVVVDVVLSETATLADVVLPAAGWGEKEGSATNAEGRVQWSSALLEPPGEAKPDLTVIAALAKRLGVDKLRYQTPWDTHPEIEELVPRYRGFSASLRDKGEYLLPRSVSRVRLYTPRPRPPAAGTLMVTVREPTAYCSNAVRGFERGGTVVRASPETLPEGYIELDTGCGITEVRVVHDDNVPEDLIIAPWHHGINEVLPRSIDPETGMLELKAIRVEPRSTARRQA